MNGWVRLLCGDATVKRLLCVALWLPCAALASPIFLLGEPDPCPDCATVTFDGGGISVGTAVTTQYAAQGVAFENTRYVDDRLGQSSAPGFSGSGLVNDSAADIVIHFTRPMVMAAFAYADSGWDPCCQPRTFSAYWGGQLVASTELPLQPAQFFTIAATQSGWESANRAYSDAAARAQAAGSAVESQTSKVSADQASASTAQASFDAALATYQLDYVKWVTCTSYGPVCDAIYLPILALDLVALDSAGSRLADAMARLQADQTQLAQLQAQYAAEQDALVAAEKDKAVWDALYGQALADGPGPGFIGFQGEVFDTLVLSGLGTYCCDFSFTTAIDTLEMMPVPVYGAPEPPGLALLGVALATLAFARRSRSGRHQR